MVRRFFDHSEGLCFFDWKSVSASNMFKWNNQDQVGVTVWGEHKVIEDYMVPHPKNHEGNNFSKFGQCNMKQRNEDGNVMSYRVETFKMNPCEAKDRFIANKSQEFNDSSIDMDTWLDLPNLSMPFGGGFNDGNDRDSIVIGLENDLPDASDFKSAGCAMEGFKRSSGLLHKKGSPYLSKPYALLTGDAMQLDGEPELFDHEDKGNDRFLDYDWANIEDFDDLDKMFRKNDSLFGNGSIDSSDAFLTGSKDVISSTSQSLPVPDLSKSGEQSWGKCSSFQQLGEHYGVKIDPSQKEKADLQNQIPRTQKDVEEKGKGAPLQCLDTTWSSKNQQISSPRVQSSAANSSQTFHSQSFEQLSSPRQVVTDYSFPAYQFPVMPLTLKIHGGNHHNSVPGGFNTYPDCSQHAKPAEAAPKPTTMTAQEKIEKLRRWQQIQAMLAIQRQRGKYNNQISGADAISSKACLQNNQNQDVTTRSSAVMEEYIQKVPLSDVSSLEEHEHDPSQMLSSSFDGCSEEEGMFYQLQDAMGKLDMRIRLSIHDSMYRLARSAMERQNAGDRSSANKSNKEEDEFSTDNESNQDRIQDSEAITNPIDRIVAHLLFHNSSVSSLMPIADGNMPMATSVWPS